MRMAVLPRGPTRMVRYFITCPECRTTWRLDRGQARAYRREGLVMPPDMPPLRKFGLLAAAILFGAIISLNRFGPLITAVCDSGAIVCWMAGTKYLLASST